jgi:formyltetrahydrofolate-dependent phosphoribosylglycinamide formyltransferase
VTKPAGLAVLASGGGTNLQALLDRFNGEAAEVARVELVIASRSGIGALDRAAAAGVSTAVVDPRAHAEGGGPELLRVLTEHRIDIVILAGYLHLIPGEVVEKFRGRMLNVHPALLPAFGGAGMYGMRVHRAVIESGARVSGATVHQVDERYDEGAIVAQWPVPVLRGDTPEVLAARVLRAEHLLLPAAVEAFLLNGSVEPPLADPSAFSLTSGAPTLESIVLLNR